MSNLLEVAMIDAILSLHRRNWSQRRIASELGINRETVARYLKQAEAAPKPANAPPGSAASEAAPKPANAPRLGGQRAAPNQPMPPGSRPAKRPKPANAPPGSAASEAAPKPANAPPGFAASEAAPKPANAPPGSAANESRAESVTPPLGLARDSGERGHGRPSECEPWREVIQSKCDLGLSAQRIYQDLSTTTASPAATTASAASSADWSRPASSPSVASSASPATRPRSTSARAPHRRPRRQAPQDPCLPHRAEPLPQGLQRGRLPPDHRRLPPLPGECLPPLRRCAQAVDPGQPQGRREEGRLVRSRAQPQGPLLRRALRHCVLAHAALHATPQGEGRAGRRLRPGERPEGETVRQPGGAEPVPPRLGADRGRHPHARHHASPGRQALRRGRAGRVAAIAAGPFPVVSAKRVARSTATATSRSSAPTTRCRRSTWLGRSGCAGTPAWCGSSTIGWSRSSCMPGKSRAGSAPHTSSSLRRRSAGSSVALPGTWAR